MPFDGGMQPHADCSKYCNERQLGNWVQLLGLLKESLPEGFKWNYGVWLELHYTEKGVNFCESQGCAFGLWYVGQGLSIHGYDDWQRKRVNSYCVHFGDLAAKVFTEAHSFFNNDSCTPLSESDMTQVVEHFLMEGCLPSQGSLTQERKYAV